MSEQQQPHPPQPKEYIDICPHKIEMTAGGDCNYTHSDCQYQLLEWDGEMLQKMLCGAPRPHPAPAQDVCGCNLDVVSPQKDCFGKYTWKESISSDDECFICPVYGYCIDVSARARAAREDVLEKIAKKMKRDLEFSEQAEDKTSGASSTYYGSRAACLEHYLEFIESLRGERR